MKADLSDTQLIRTQTDSYRLSETVPATEPTFGSELFLMLFSCSVVGAIAILLFRKFSEKWDTRIEAPSVKIPCPNCQFFSKSSYLRCAVRPKTTMTNDAVDCMDFEPRTK